MEKKKNMRYKEKKDKNEQERKGIEIKERGMEKTRKDDRQLVKKDKN